MADIFVWLGVVVFLVGGALLVLELLARVLCGGCCVLFSIL